MSVKLVSYQKTNQLPNSKPHFLIRYINLLTSLIRTKLTPVRAFLNLQGKMKEHAQMFRLHQILFKIKHLEIKEASFQIKMSPLKNCLL